MQGARLRSNLMVVMIRTVLVYMAKMAMMMMMTMMTMMTMMLQCLDTGSKASVKSGGGDDQDYVGVHAM